MVLITIDGYTMTVQVYQINKKAKFFAYPVPNTNRSPFVMMGSQNTTYHVESMEVSDSGIEDLTSIFISGTVISLVDVEGNTNNVYCKGFKSDLLGGEPSVYRIVADFIDTQK